MKRAFTLIELLVVIAIIAILAAILFPVFTQAKLAAKGSADLSNEKQILTAMMLYGNSNDDRCPASHHDLESGETVADLYPWYQPLQPYIKNDGVFKSPLLDTVPTLFPPLVNATIWKTYRTDYLINGFYAHGTDLSSSQSQPASQIMLGPRHKDIGFFDYHAWDSAPDGNWERGFLDGSGYRLGDVSTDSQVVDAANVGRLNRGNNWGYADGHAKWAAFAQTLDKTKAANDVTNFGQHNIDNLPPVEE